MGDAPRFFLLRFSKSCSADRFPFRSRPREASSQPRGSGARTDVLQPLRRVRRSLRDGSQCFAGDTCLDDRRSPAEP